MSISSKAFRLLAAARRDWGRMGPTDLWHMAEFDDPDPISYLSKLLSTRITRFDLAEIMSSAINSIAGEKWSDVSGAKVIVPLKRDHDVRQMFTNDEGSQEAERLREAIKDAARRVAAENYKEQGGAEAPQGPPSSSTESTPPVEHGEPSQPTKGAPVVVERDPKLWAQHVRHDEDEIVAWIRSGAVLILDSGGKTRLFSSEAEAEAEFGPLKELSGNLPAAKPPDRTPMPVEAPPVQPPERRPQTTRPPASSILAEFRDKAVEAKRLVGELMSIQRSLETTTGFSGMTTNVVPAYTELAKMSGSGGAPPQMRDYDSARDDPAMSSLLSLLHDLLERQDKLDEAGVNVYSLSFLREGLYEFLVRHAKAASCDVLRRRPNGGMPKNGRNLGGPRGIALNVLKKEAIQLSKGNIRATKGGTITIDPGLMNCPVVREVMRDLDTKASDMRSVRKRLDALGMLVTQGQHGQVQVYCLVRSESEDGAKTKMCQWFIDAHGNDGKFKIECAKA